MTDVFDFSAFPILRTERLTLREMTQQDAMGVYAIRSDYQVTRYNTGPAYTHIDQARQLIRRISDGYRDHDELRWGITRRGAEERIIGMIGYNYWNRKDRRGSVGYDLARGYWGRGFMTEALQAVIAFGFDAMNLNRIEADCTVENEASARLLLRVGFGEEGLLREQYFEEGRFWDLRLFALLRRDYQG